VGIESRLKVLGALEDLAAVCGKGDGAKLAEFLAAGVAQRERRYELIKDEFLAECRLRQLELPTADQARPVCPVGVV
jgi:hypothetical protein